jgi:enoyl-CoA hydratase/carnithine racemase
VYEHILYEVEGGVATITLNVPERRNATTVPMIHELVDAIDRLDADPEVRCVIFTGAGRIFCAGADMQQREDTFRVVEREFDWRTDGASALTLRIYHSPKPFIAAINGSAVGVGLTMTFPMDIRLCAEDAKLGLLFSQRGMIIDGASGWFLPRLVPMTWATDWAYSGRLFSPREALQAGLVRSLHAAEEVLPAALALASEIATANPASVSMNKALLWRMASDPTPEETARVDSEALAELGLRPDAAEGVQAFLERRPPRFESQVPRDLPRSYPGER